MCGQDRVADVRSARASEQADNIVRIRRIDILADVLPLNPFAIDEISGKSHRATLLPSLMLQRIRRPRCAAHELSNSSYRVP
jgi:hypothetical protein